MPIEEEQAAEEHFTGVVLMAAIRLLPAPVDPPSTLESRQQTSQSTSLALSTRPIASSTAYRNNGNASEDVWSVSVGDDGTFNFYAAPHQSSANSASSQWDDFLSAQSYATGWNTRLTSNAAAQYTLLGIMPLPTYGHSLDVYA
jgi:hypothetical protein